MLLASGRIVYFGEAKSAINYFNKVGYTWPMHYNPADFMLELITDSFIDIYFPIIFIKK